MKQLASVFLLFGLAACATNSEMAAESARSTAVTSPSIYGLLGERGRLSLSSAQIEELDSIAEWLAVETQRFRDQAPELRDQPIPDDALGGEVVGRLAEINRQAMGSVREILSAEQQTLVCNRASQRLSERRTAEAEANRGPLRRGPAATPAGARWSWCPTDDGASAVESR